MKVLNKSKVEARFNDSSIKPFVSVSNIKGYKIGSLNLDKLYTLIIPGTPISDSRPRHRADGDYFYNPHLASYLKVLKRTLELADINNEYEICILSPMYVNIKVYRKIPNTHLRYLNKDELKDLEDEILPASSIMMDNDNIEKVTWDSLQVMNTILKDEYVVENKTEKYFTKYSNRERLEIYIYYTDNNCYSTPLIKRIKEYMYYTISMKYKRIKKIDDRFWRDIFYRNIVNFYTTYKGKKETKGIQKVLSGYKVEELRLIENGTNREIIEKTIISNIESIFAELNKIKKG